MGIRDRPMADAQRDFVVFLHKSWNTSGLAALANRREGKQRRRIHYCSFYCWVVGDLGIWGKLGDLGVQVLLGTRLQMA
jgi:hypothetical protein